MKPREYASDNRIETTASVTIISDNSTCSENMLHHFSEEFRYYWSQLSWFIAIEVHEGLAAFLRSAQCLRLVCIASLITHC